MSVRTKQCRRCLASRLNRIYNGNVQKCHCLCNHSPTKSKWETQGGFKQRCSVHFYKNNIFYRLLRLKLNFRHIVLVVCRCIEIISKSGHLKQWGLIDGMEISHNAHLYFYLPFPSQVYLSRGISNLGVSLTEWKSATTHTSFTTYHFQARYIYVMASQTSLTEWRPATTHTSIGCSCQLLTISKPGIS